MAPKKFYVQLGLVILEEVVREAVKPWLSRFLRKLGRAGREAPSKPAATTVAPLICVTNSSEKKEDCWRATGLTVVPKVETKSSSRE